MGVQLPLLRIFGTLNSGCLIEDGRLIGGRLVEVINVLIKCCLTGSHGSRRTSMGRRSSTKPIVLVSWSSSRHLINPK